MKTWRWGRKMIEPLTTLAVTHCHKLLVVWRKYKVNKCLRFQRETETTNCTQNQNACNQDRWMDGCFHSFRVRIFAIWFPFSSLCFYRTASIKSRVLHKGMFLYTEGHHCKKWLELPIFGTGTLYAKGMSFLFPHTVFSVLHEALSCF